MGHPNGNIAAWINTATLAVSGRADYGPFGERVQATGVASTLPFGFSTKYTDAETGLLYYGYRYMSPSLGRWPSRDPIEEAGGLHLYAFVRNNGVRYIDVLGRYLSSFPDGAPTFFDEWPQARQDAWFKDFQTKLGPIINAAAAKHCIPRELLAAAIANEMIDYSRSEYIGEKMGRGNSVGPGQIQASTVTGAGISISGASSASEIRKALMDAGTNIDVAAQLMKKYLDELCKNATAGTMSGSFAGVIAGGCKLDDFCCLSKGDRSKIVNMDVPSCLIRSMAAIWNNGPKIINLPDVKKAPNAIAHGENAGGLDGAPLLP